MELTEEEQLEDLVAQADEGDNEEEAISLLIEVAAEETEPGSPVDATVSWAIEGAGPDTIARLSFFGSAEERPAGGAFYEDPFRVIDAPSTSGSVTLEIDEEPFVLRGYALAEDGRSAWSSAHEVVAEGSEPPLADAGSDQVIVVDPSSGQATVALDASASNATGAPIASFTWYRVGMDGERVHVAEGEEVEIIVGVGEHAFELEVVDEAGVSATDGVMVEARLPGAPVAVIEPEEGEGFTVSDVDGSGFVEAGLNASASSSPDGEIASYAWYVDQERIGEGVSVVVNVSLDGEAEAMEEVTLAVEDDQGGADAVSQTVTAVANQPPVAVLNAPMEDEEVLEASVERELELSFNASDSHDPDGEIASYAWRALMVDEADQVPVASGEGVSFSHVFEVSPEEGNVGYVVEVTVEDHAGAEDTVSVFFTLEETGNVPPVAGLEADCTYLSCTFDASGSFDPVPGQEVESYDWKIHDPDHGAAEDGVIVPLDTDPMVVHDFSGPGSFMVNVTVWDEEGLRDEASVVVSVDNIRVSSASFEDGETIPQRHTCQGGAVNAKFGMRWSYSGPSDSSYPTGMLRQVSDISPPLTIEGIDMEATESLVLIVSSDRRSDPDDPESPFHNWIVWGIPAVNETVRLEEGEVAPEGAHLGVNSHGEEGYAGPCPESNVEHSYTFQVHALEKPLGLDPGASAQDMQDALEGQGQAVQSQAGIRGLYHPGCQDAGSILEDTIGTVQPLGVNHACMNAHPDRVQDELLTVTVPSKVTIGSEEDRGGVPSEVTVTWGAYPVDQADPEGPVSPDETWNTTFIMLAEDCASGTGFLFEEVCYEHVDSDGDGIPDVVESFVCAFWPMVELLEDQTGTDGALGTCRQGSYTSPMETSLWPLELTLVPSEVTDPEDLIESLLENLPSDIVP